MSGPIPRLRLAASVFLVLIMLLATLLAGIMEQRAKMLRSYDAAAKMVTLLGLTDLALTTEARYTRHPAVSDGVVPFMDHPGAMEHFPSGSFFAPVR